MKFEPRIKVTFYDVDGPTDGPSFTSPLVSVVHNQLWIGGKLMASYRAHDGAWRLTREAGANAETTWADIKMEVLP
jgi:hypothetical protein